MPARAHGRWPVFLVALCALTELCGGQGYATTGVITRISIEPPDCPRCVCVRVSRLHIFCCMKTHGRTHTLSLTFAPGRRTRCTRNTSTISAPSARFWARIFKPLANAVWRGCLHARDVGFACFPSVNTPHLHLLQQAKANADMRPSHTFTPTRPPAPPRRWFRHDTCSLFPVAGDGCGNCSLEFQVRKSVSVENSTEYYSVVTSEEAAVGCDGTCPEVSLASLAHSPHSSTATTTTTTAIFIVLIIVIVTMSTTTISTAWNHHATRDQHVQHVVRSSNRYSMQSLTHHHTTRKHVGELCCCTRRLSAPHGARALD
jgi:hypothetical protein